MKSYIFLISSIISLSVYAQNEFIPTGNGYRITRSQYYESSRNPKYRYDYAYSNEGLLLSIVKKRLKDSEWLTTESKEFKYDQKAKSVIVNYIRLNKQKRDIDTFKIEDGQVNYVARFREEPHNDYLYQYLYNYENGNLTKVKKVTYVYIENFIDGKKVIKQTLVNGLWEIAFVYENNKIKNIKQTETTFSRKWMLEWNRDSLQKIDIYDIINGEEKLASTYNIKYESNRSMKVADRLGNSGYKYDNENNLIEYSFNDDSESTVDEYLYEQGIGNASIYSEMKNIFDYIVPIPRY
jgi:hypothetical protein